ncbi:NmrA family transcriptional regulator [Actinomycetospora termitidis]|uniref:NmrA family transcriptional regulator n=1 Tax=Actinomycetospora termitidis TaxID=3053470 RepID=A0ABT7MCQ1_9PSEU|nr:NmrA family transcriptional regulator [Actinomycetospora sp. Odt1-22]MDL5158446.1 NmrA family transcriptional regulator [Actinomycetospora sp. Odt1-22]
MLIVVTGATGKTGRRIVHRLHTAGSEVRAVGRTSAPRHDWADPATWPAVLAPDAEGRPPAAVYLAYAPDAGFPGADAVLGAFAGAAADAGVGRLVLLTGRGESGAVRSEEAVAAAGLPTVVVRAAFFAQGFTEDLFAESVAAGILRVPAGDVPEPFVDLEDLADVATAGLLGDLTTGVHELTGPEALTFGEVAAELTRLTGGEVVYEPVTPEEFHADLVGVGLPDEDAAGITGLFAELFDGRNVRPTDGVAQALGRPARPFATALAAAFPTAGAR